MTIQCECRFVNRLSEHERIAGLRPGNTVFIAGCGISGQLPDYSNQILAEEKRKNRKGFLFGFRPKETSHLPAYTLVGGNPARVIRSIMKLGRTDDPPKEVES